MVYVEGQLPSQKKQKKNESAPIDILDLTADDTSEAAPSGEASTSNIPMEDEIKDELEDQLDQDMPPPTEQEDDDGKDDEDEDVDEKIDQKPKLRVNCASLNCDSVRRFLLTFTSISDTGFQIYRSALIVV